MCGIIGLLARNSEYRKRLGELATPMVLCMSTRGPDSAGLALFHEPLANGSRRFGLFHPDRSFDWSRLETTCREQLDASLGFVAEASHASLTSEASTSDVRQHLADAHPHVHLLSVGRSMEVFKDEGLPDDIAETYRFSEMTGTHIIAHTRMATESLVSPAHAHPFTAGEDFCLVHNGSLSNPNSVRRQLERKGIRFETDNDTEAGCRFLEWRMQQGDTLEEGIQRAFEVLDGFYTFLIATPDRMVLVRDAFACKPAVVAETDQYIAVASEFRSLAHLPAIASAHVYEPEPQHIYSWPV